MNKDLKIVFMGTPDFAVASLRALVEGGYNVVGVVTTPDRAIGRSQSRLQPCAVKQYAIEAGLPTLQPEKLKDPEFLAALAAWNVDLQVVVAFRMLPEAVWAMPRLGTFNLHASLLPQYRGAAPINWAIINGEQETGVTTFLLNHEIDTGKILFQERIAIDDNDTAETVHDRLMTLGAALVPKTVDALAAGTVVAIDQHAAITSDTVLHPAPKIFRDTCRIDWTRPVAYIRNFVRGLSPYPAAWTEINTPDSETAINLKIFETETIPTIHDLQPGSPVSDGKTFLKIAASDGFIMLKDIQIAGKKRMKIEEFLRGHGNRFISG
jgi:methionyl-tRNA formyltransferase